MTTLDPVANRLGAIETRLDKLETRFDHLEARLDKLETRFDKVETRFDKLEADMAGLRGEWRVVKWVLTAFVAPTCITLIAGTFYFIRSLA